MFIDKNQKIRLTRSYENYTSKLESQICKGSYYGFVGISEKPTTYKDIGRRKMTFLEVSLDKVSQLGSLINLGYVLGPTYDWIQGDLVQTTYTDSSGITRTTMASPFSGGKYTKGDLKMQFMTKDHYKGSQIVFIDVDETRATSLEEYISWIPANRQPTLAYYTYSDGIEKHGKVSRRFRLVYVFNEFLGRDLWEPISRCLYQEICMYTNEYPDPATEKLTQLMDGAWGADVWYSYNIYDRSDFPWEKFCPVNTPVSNPGKVSEKIFRDSLRNTKPEFYSKYHRYRYIYRTEYPDRWRELGEDYEFQIVDTDNFLSLELPVSEVNGKYRTGRHKIMCNLPFQIRLIDPTASIDEVYFSCVCFFNNYIDNWDRGIDKGYIRACTERAFTNYDVQENVKNNYYWIERCKKLGRRVILRVSRKGWDKGIRRVDPGIKREVIGKITELEILDKWYPGMTVQGLMNITGLSEVQAKRYYKKLSLKKRTHDYIRENYDSQKSIEDNIKELEIFGGIKISGRSYYRIINGK